MKHMDEHVLPTPLVKLEIIKSPDNKGYIRYSKAFTVQQAKAKKYNLIAQYKTQDFSTAYSIAGVFGEAFHFGGLMGLGATLLSNKTKIKVLDKITFFETLRLDYKDSKYNVEGNVLIEIHKKWAELTRNYQFGYKAEYFQWGHAKAYTTYTRLHEVDYFSQQTDIVAFEYAGHVFNRVSFCIDYCITGISVDNSYYNQYEDDYSITLDLTCDYVTFHHKDIIYYFNQNVYLNGKRIFTIPELFSYFEHKYKKYDVTNLVPEDVKNFLCKLYPYVKEIVSYNESVTIER